jgi:hypothetical protein
MDFHRRLYHPNFVGDLFVLETGDNPHHHLAFTQRQRVEARAQFCNSFVADNVNNVMALAFGVLIVLLLLAGSLWIMAHLNRNMMPMERIMQMQR